MWPATDRGLARSIRAAGAIRGQWGGVQMKGQGMDRITKPQIEYLAETLTKLMRETGAIESTDYVATYTPWVTQVWAVYRNDESGRWLVRTLDGGGRGNVGDLRALYVQGYAMVWALECVVSKVPR